MKLPTGERKDDETRAKEAAEMRFATTFTRTSPAFGGSTVMVSTLSGFFGSQATAAVHSIGLPCVARNSSGTLSDATGVGAGATVGVGSTAPAFASFA